MKLILSRLRQRFPLVMIIFGLTLLSISGIHFTLRDRSLRLRASQLPQVEVTAYQAGEFGQPISNKLPEPTKISTGKKVDVTITPGVLQDDVWSISDSTATFLTQSARPGEGGNVVIYGHNTRPILGNIRTVKVGEEIAVTTADGQQHRYRVTWTKEVRPSDVSSVQPTDTEVLTVYTCTGFLDSKRFIVRAEPIIE